MIGKKKVISLLGVFALSISLHSILQTISVKPESDNYSWQPLFHDDAPPSQQSADQRNISQFARAKNVTDYLLPSTELLSTRPHPHAGARYPNGSFGYIADITLVRKHVLKTYQKSTDNNVSEAPPLSYLSLDADQFDAVCNSKPREPFLERKAGWRLLRRMEVNGLDGHEKQPSSTDSKLLCAD
jgi:hypothetical protein